MKKLLFFSIFIFFLSCEAPGDVSERFAGSDKQTGTASAQVKTQNPTGLESLLSEAQFNTLLPNRNKVLSYQSFVKAVDFIQSHPDPYWNRFLKEGDKFTRQLELISFLAHTSQETTGGWETAEGGYAAYGWYFLEEVHIPHPYIEPGHFEFPAREGRSYHGRGLIQISWNYNYGAFSQDILGDKNILLDNPELVSKSGELLILSAIWFWMKTQSPKPSLHDTVMAMTADNPVHYWNYLAPGNVSAKRAPSFGTMTNIINGGIEIPAYVNKTKARNRVKHFMRYSNHILYEKTLDNYSVTANGAYTANPLVPYTYQSLNDSSRFLRELQLAEGVIPHEKLYRQSFLDVAGEYGTLLTAEDSRDFREFVEHTSSPAQSNGEMATLSQELKDFIANNKDDYDSEPSVPSDPEEGEQNPDNGEGLPPGQYITWQLSNKGYPRDFLVIHNGIKYISVFYTEGDIEPGTIRVDDQGFSLQGWSQQGTATAEEMKLADENALIFYGDSQPGEGAGSGSEDSGSQPGDGGMLGDYLGDDYSPWLPQSYIAGSKVSHEGVVYLAQFWANADQKPYGTVTVVAYPWKPLGFVPMDDETGNTPDNGSDGSNSGRPSFLPEDGGLSSNIPSGNAVSYISDHWNRWTNRFLDDPSKIRIYYEENYVPEDYTVRIYANNQGVKTEIASLPGLAAKQMRNLYVNFPGITKGWEYNVNRTSLIIAVYNELGNKVERVYNADGSSSAKAVSTEEKALHGPETPGKHAGFTSNNDNGVVNPYIGNNWNRWANIDKEDPSKVRIYYLERFVPSNYQVKVFSNHNGLKTELASLPGLGAQDWRNIIVNFPEISKPWDYQSNKTSLILEVHNNRGERVDTVYNANGTYSNISVGSPEKGLSGPEPPGPNAGYTSSDSSAVSPYINYFWNRWTNFDISNPSRIRVSYLENDIPSNYTVKVIANMRGDKTEIASFHGYGTRRTRVINANFPGITKGWQFNPKDTSIILEVYNENGYKVDRVYNKYGQSSVPIEIIEKGLSGTGAPTANSGFTSNNASGRIPSYVPSIWNRWIGRFKDEPSKVRIGYFENFIPEDYTVKVFAKNQDLITEVASVPGLGKQTWRDLVIDFPGITSLDQFKGDKTSLIIEVYNDKGLKVDKVYNAEGTYTALPVAVSEKVLHKY